jgi:hypothetical protein
VLYPVLLLKSWVILPFQDPSTFGASSGVPFCLLVGRQTPPCPPALSGYPVISSLFLLCTVSCSSPSHSKRLLAGPPVPACGPLATTFRVSPKALLSFLSPAAPSFPPSLPPSLPLSTPPLSHSTNPILEVLMLPLLPKVPTGCYRPGLPGISSLAPPVHLVPHSCLVLTQSMHTAPTGVRWGGMRAHRCPSVGIGPLLTPGMGL